MWLDKLKDKAEDFIKQNLNKRKTNPKNETYLIKHDATQENIDMLKKMSKIDSVSVEDIQYITPTDEKIAFNTPEELETYLNKKDELDLDSIGDKPKELTTVYGDCKKRNTKSCPHCGYVFDKPPTRGKKCPSCGNQFYVRVGNRLFASDLLNPQDAAAADCFKHMHNFGVSIEFAKYILNKRTKTFKFESSSRDVIWSIMRAFPNTLTNDPLKMVEVTAHMNHLVAMYENNCGRDPRSLLETKIENNITYCKLMIILNNPGQDYLYVSSNSCCEVCRSRYGKKIKIKDAEEKMPIPFKDCQNKLHPKDKHNFCMADYLWYEPPKY